MFFLSICAIFKNESVALGEWLQHYIDEGVEHFYLIDNGSTDNYQSIIKKFESYITLFIDDRKHAQTQHYNYYVLQLAKKQTDWLMIVDLDEFVYSRNGYTKITDYLKTLPDKIGKIGIFWKLYGSSGYINQPDNIIHNFLNRETLKFNSYKQIVRTKYLNYIDVHDMNLNIPNEEHAISTDGEQFYTNSQFFTSEQIIDKSAKFNLHLNHYAIQSYNWFRDVKMTRGDVISSSTDNFRNDEYFKRYDTNDIYDDELSQKIKTNKLKKYFNF